MNFDFLCDFAGVAVGFLVNGSNYTGNIWAWDLDPYLITDRFHADINVLLSFNTNWDLFSNNVQFQNRFTLSEQITGFFRHKVSQLDNQFYTWEYIEEKMPDPILIYKISNDFKTISLEHDRSLSAGYLPFHYMGRIISYSLINYNILTLHGVLMDYEGNGIVISANSGVGKSTHARLWRDYKNALIINGDRSYLKKENGKWFGYGLPWSGTSGEHINKKVPIKAIVVIEQNKENMAARLDGFEAFHYLLPHVQYPNWNQELAEKALDHMTELIEDIPVFRLKCRPDEESVNVLKKVLDL